MQNLSLKQLTDKQRDAWKMRYQFGWRMKRIALELGVNEPAVSRLLRRARVRAGLPGRRRVSVIRVKPRLTRAASLSDSFES